MPSNQLGLVLASTSQFCACVVKQPLRVELVIVREVPKIPAGKYIAQPHPLVTIFKYSLHGRYPSVIRSMAISLLRFASLSIDSFSCT